jgi:transposase
MQQIELDSSQKTTKFDLLSREDIIQKYTIIEDELARAIREIYELRNQRITDEQLQLLMADNVESLQQTVFGRKSERYKKPVKQDGGDNGGGNKEKTPRVKKLSERYPSIPIRTELISLDPVPCCTDCQKPMLDSGLRETTEQLTVIPKKYEIIEQARVIYRCTCHSGLVTTPAMPRIIPGSSYSDEMITDVALSKYCDLIPMNRYVAMADRAGLAHLPANSAIETTHGFADFVSPVYTLIKQGVLEARWTAPLIWRDFRAS